MTPTARNAELAALQLVTNKITYWRL